MAKTFSLLSLLSLFLVCGCGGSSSMPTASAVQGKVAWKGAIPADLAIKATNRMTGVTCLGKLESDGTCRLLCGDSTLVPYGDYALSVAAWSPAVPPQDYEKLLREGKIRTEDEVLKPIAAKLRDPKKSGWTLTVDKSNVQFELSAL